MKSQGGKSKVRREIADLLIRVRDLAAFSAIEDRCCGSLAVSRGIYEAGECATVAVDANEALICTYQRVRDGWIPPKFLDAESYEEIRNGKQRSDDPLTAFAMIFCSYGGKWGGGFQAPDMRWPGDTARFASAKAHDLLIELRPMLQRMELRADDCRIRLPRKPSVLYFDPPYRGTLQYKRVAPFPYPSFLQCAADASHKHAVVISEFAMPPEWREVAAIRVPSPGLMKGKVERLFVLRGGLADRLLVAA